MKTKALLLLSVAFFLAVVSCKKDAEVNKDTFKIENETVEPGTQSVRIAGTYNYAGTIDAITLELGRQSDLMDADEHRTILDGTDFSVKVEGLRTNTTYYYRYLVDYGVKTPYVTEMKSFSTPDYNLPEVETNAVESVGVNRAVVSGEVKSDGGGDAVTLRGVCWSTRHNPSIGDEYANAGEGEGVFTCELTNLYPEKTYYARAFAGNSMGIAYGAELTFVTLKAGVLAEVHTLGVVGNAMLEATVEGEVTMEGASAVLERGVCYSKEHYPLTSGLHMASGTGVGTFTSHLTNLEAGATYYVRAYAINSLGIAYGDEMSFVAQTEMTVPVVVTNMVKDITESSATGSGVVVADGGSSITRRGLCWGLQPDPTIDDTHADCGVGSGAFNCLMSHLTNQTTYYVRAYAENAVGLAYGELVSVTVGYHDQAIPPTVVTGEVSDIALTSAIGHGNVTNDGGASVTERGLCWSTSQNPTTSGSHASSGTGTGNYTVNMTNLEANTTYYVRAYAINSAGTSYGSEVSFTTSQEVSLPAVTTSEVTNITHNSAQGGGNVTSNGGASVTERGICWSTRPSPTINGNHASNGAGTGSYVVNMTSLAPNTIYYVRAYATNSVGTAYGDELEFRTETASTLPTVITGEVINITQTTATGSGNVTSDGGTTVTERGICWSTSHNPTTNGSHASNGTGTGEFTVNMTGLVPNTTYYVRAYAKNSNGESYGGEASFVTSAIPQYTINISANPSNGGTVTGGGTYQQGQQCTVTATANSGYAFTNWTENGSVVSTNASYTFTVTGNRTLVANFTLQTSLPTVITNTVTNITQTSATGGGNVTNDGGAIVIERGICWSMSPNPTISDNHASSGTGTGSYSVQMTDLSPNTYYYVRAYAINEIGTNYGNEEVFHTLIDNIEDFIEDFETGDFSKFDWQLDSDYPWTITTSNPYEGVYCMKCGNVNVASSTSNMTVTIDIPADGEMSFFGKISSEANWDYGNFYIDNVQMGSYTGAGEWGEKVFDITAGTHTFKWSYIKDGSVNSNDDCFYVDNIRFYRVPEPIQPGWHTYATSEFNNAVGSNVGTPRWAYRYPASFLAQYAGFTMTKVSLFSDNMYSAVGGNYTCTIYRGGNEPMAGEAISTITVDVPQNMNAWVDFDLTTPVAITGAETLWVVWTVNSALSNYPAGCCGDIVDDGTWWNAGLEAGYTWEHTTYGTWTMRQYFTDRSGRGFYNYPSENRVKVDVNHSAIRNSRRPALMGRGQNHIRNAKTELGTKKK